MGNMIRESTLDEFANWYLRRMKRRGQETAGFPLVMPVPDSPAERRDALKTVTGKCPKWFERAQWTIVGMTAAELATVIVVDTPKIRSRWLIRGDTVRTLGNTARIAEQIGYFEIPEQAAKGHREYYVDLLEGKLRLFGPDRLVLRELGVDEDELPNETQVWLERPTSTSENCRPGILDLHLPIGTLYLHDGFGRALPLMVLVQRGLLPATTPVEAFVARLQEDPTA